MSDRAGYIIADQFATHFLTFSTVGWVDLFTRKKCRDILLESFRYCVKNKGLVINAYVIMSNHVHIIVTAQESSVGLSAIVRDMKKYTSKLLLNWVLKSGEEKRKDWMEVVFKYHSKFNRRNKNYQIWQQDNKPMVCSHPKFTSQKIEYIHQNPVIAGIVDKPDDYRYSSARNYSGRNDFLLKVDVIDFGVQEGFVLT